MRKWRLPILIGCVALYVVIQSFSLQSGWFALDDMDEVSLVRGMDHWWQLLGYDCFHLFRPVKNLLFLLFIRLSEWDLAYARLVSIGIGVCTYFAGYRLFRTIFGNDGKALLAAFFWFLSPVMVSSTAWLSCTNIQVMTLFSVLALSLHLEGRTFLSAACFTLALFSYESAVSLLPMMIAIDFLRHQGRKGWALNWKRYVIYAVPFVAYAIARFCVGAAGALNGSFLNTSRIQMMISSPYFFWQHLVTWLWPFGRMTIVGSYRWGQVPVWGVAGCWLVGVSLMLSAWFLRSRCVEFSIGIAIFIVGFAPMSNCLGFGNGPYGDFYLTIASVGLAIASVALVWEAFRSRSSARLVWVLSAVLFSLTRVAAVAESVSWCRGWSNARVGSEMAVRAFPDAYSSRILSANILSREGEYARAVEIVDGIESLIGPESDAMASVCLIRAVSAINYFKDQAAANYWIDQTLQYDQGVSTKKFVHFYRGCVLEDLEGNADAARKEFEAAVQIGRKDIDLVQVLNRLARLEALGGDVKKAIEHWEMADRLCPDDGATLWNLAIAYKDLGDMEKANGFAARASKIMPLR